MRPGEEARPGAGAGAGADASPEASPAWTLGRHTLELATAGGITALAVLTLVGAAQLDTGWADTGPQSGYFPWRLGWLLLVVGLVLLLQAWRGRPALRGQPFATGEQLRRSAALFVPALLMVAAMAWTGIYLAGAVFLAAMARRHGGWGWGRAAALGLGTMVVFFGVFELWFGVPLPKGPVEAWLGY